MPHNFKEGIDWAGDSTGNTPLSNHWFVSKSGDDGTGTGSPTAPYLTIGAAVSAAADGDTIVLGTGQYSEENIDSPYHFIGDGYVVLKGTGSNTCFANKADNFATSYTNLIIDNYSRIISNQTNFACTFTGCTFVGGDFFGRFSGNPGSGKIISCSQCIFLNVDGYIAEASSASISESILINSLVTEFGGLFKSNYVDADSTVTFTRNDGTDHDPGTDFNFNNFRGTAVINGVSYSDLATQKASTTSNANSIDQDPKFNNEEGGDFTLQSDSPHIGVGEGGVNIGGTVVGLSFQKGNSNLDDAVVNNANVSYDASGQLQVDSGTSQQITLSEVDYGFLKYLPTISASGYFSLVTDVVPDADNALTNPNNLIMEIRWAGLDNIFGTYEKFRIGERPTVDDAGKYNGEVGYTWAQQNPIAAKKWQLRITLLEETNYTEA